MNDKGCVMLKDLIQPIQNHHFGTIDALICAAGVGSRAGGDNPKQYQMIGEVPMLVHTLAAWLNIPWVRSVQVVIAPQDDCFEARIMPYLHAAVARGELSAARLQALYVLPVGGESRADSVCQGLATMHAWHETLSAAQQDFAWVMVHDAARPCISAAAVQRLRDEVWAQAAMVLAHISDLNDGQKDLWESLDSVGGLLALPVTDTIKQSNVVKQNLSELSEKKISVRKTVNRAHLWAAQTPQMFGMAALYTALSDALLDKSVIQSLTDEASVMEWAGFSPLLVLGDVANIKVTYAHDFELAHWYLCQKSIHLPLHF
jgi:2-C-methyl-D-erythritol 4-phosphate cytidylyltransferase